MKRAIHIVFWTSLLLAAAVVLLRTQKDESKSATQPSQNRDMMTGTSTHITSPKLAREVPASSPDASRQPRPAPRHEADLMQEIRTLVKANPSLALDLARQARERFGKSPQADERDKLLVESLVNLQRIGEARVETQYYYRQHPEGRFRHYLWSMTGARPDPPAGPRPVAPQ